MNATGYAAPRTGLWSGPREVSAEAWIVAGLVVAAAVIRLLVIDTQSFWRDEALTAFEAGLPFGSMIRVVTHVETTPPLYFVLAWTWGHLFGVTEASLRMPSTIAGVALVPTGYLCARELASRRAGVIAAALVTVNPFLIWYSQEARAYMLLTALCGASFLFFVRAREDPSKRNLVWWSGLSALALTTHFFAGFLVFPEAICLLWARRRRRVALAVGAVTLVQLAMLAFAIADSGHGTAWIAHIPRLNRISGAISEWGVSILYERVSVRDGLIAGVVLIGVLVALVLAGGDRRTRSVAKLAGGLVACVWLVPLALAVAGLDYFLSRNLMPAVVPLVVLIAVACAAPRARLLGATLAGGLIALFSYAAIDVQTHAYLERPDWRAVARALGPARVPRAVLAAGGLGAQPLKIYLPGVDWTAPPSHRVRVEEIDVVGARKTFGLLGPRSPRKPILLEAGSVVTSHGWPLPARVAPPGARLLARFRLQNWIVARFLLRHPLDVSSEELAELSPRYFLRTPDSLLVFFEPGER